MNNSGRDNRPRLQADCEKLRGFERNTLERYITIAATLLFFSLLALQTVERVQAGTAFAFGGRVSHVGQAKADNSFNASVAQPAYTERHPRVLFDEGHNNPYTSIGNYKPFADLLTNDGYQVTPGKTALSKESLTGYDVLVIVNASGPGERRDSSAFTEAECNAVKDWVAAGGALLLISDHAPFSAAIASLAKKFDVGLTNGFTIETAKFNKESDDQTELVFTRADGLIVDHPITQGRDKAEQINRVMSFSGTSLKGPGGGVAFLKLADTARDVLPPDRKPTPEDPSPDHKQVSAAGRAQAIALEVGKGRVVVLAEAAMLTAQVAPQGFRFGFNVTGIDNRQLALNIAHWLSRLLK